MSVPGDLLDLSAAGWNDRASSLRMSPGSPVTVFADAGFLGTCQVLQADEPQLSNTDVGNDALSSIRLGAYCTTARDLWVTNAGSSGLTVRYRVKDQGQWSDDSREFGAGGRALFQFYDARQIDVDIQTKFGLVWQVSCQDTITTSTSKTYTVHGIPGFAWCDGP